MNKMIVIFNGIPNNAHIMCPEAIKVSMNTGSLEPTTGTDVVLIGMLFASIALF